MTTIATKQNRLVREKSPYLRQHAENPVDWYPWGDEAFEKAKIEDKPIFLSIGYSTCHWCHVMAHESFESEEAAALLNAHFVSVKVDREERPDIDMVYMNVCQAMTGSGGWPLTVLLTPDKKPFFAGTYLPLHTKFGRMGLIELLQNVAALWRDKRDELTAHGEKLAAQLSQQERAIAQADAVKALEDAFLILQSQFDDKRGGFSYAPKFPMPHYLLYLLADHQANGRALSLGMAHKSLASMYHGGLFDHVGGGFARYSTDAQWLVPHFEKMLYDNALLLRAYAECCAVTGDDMLCHVARKTAAYLIRDMQSQSGGFYSAEDADSEGEEGRFYVWEQEELQRLLTEDEIARLESRYGLSPGGNFEGKTILNRIKAGGMADKDDEALLAKLFDIRQKRVPPFKDTKIMASWNGLVIEALSSAGMLLHEPEYIRCAQKAADFVLSHMSDNSGSLVCGTYLNGEAGPAFLADYANMINGLLALYAAMRQTNYLYKAQQMASKMLALFADERGFSMSVQETLFMHPRDEYDGAMPSGSACAVMALVSLWHLTGESKWGNAADAAIQAMLPMASDSPAAHVYFLLALMRYRVLHRQVVIVAEQQNAEAAAAYDALRQRYMPFTTLIWYDKSEQMDSLMPHLAQYKKDAPFAGYVCENFACKQPVFSVEQLLNMV